MSSTRPEDIEDIYDLSPLQQGILFNTVQAPESRVYFVQIVVTLHGHLDRDAFEYAWTRVVERQPILRTSFHWEDLDKPLQVVHRSRSLPVAWHEWCAAPDEEAQRLDEFCHADRSSGFSLRQAPLMRLSLIRTASERHILVWSYHHILMDGWSVEFLLREVLVQYESRLTGREAALPLVRPYRDYIRWLQHQDAGGAAAWWREEFQGLTAPTPLPIARPRACFGNNPALYRSVKVRVGPEATDSLRAFCSQRRLTMSTLVSAAWSLLISRYSGCQDVVFGLSVSGRSGEVLGVDSMVGLFINTVPVRVRVSEKLAAEEWLQEIQKQHLVLRQYEYVSLTDIRRWTSWTPGAPLFDSLVVFERYPIEQRRSAAETGCGLSIESRPRFTEAGADLPLTLCVAETKDGIVGSLSYDVSLFSDETVRRAAVHLQNLLAGMPAGRSRPAAYLPMLAKAEERQILVDWNNNPAHFGAEQFLHQLFESAAARSGDATSICCADESWSYAMLDRSANAVAGALIRLGVGPENIVGICASRTPRLVAAMLGTLKGGAAYLPLDPNYPEERLSWMLGDSGARVILTDSGPSNLLAADGRHVVSLAPDSDIWRTPPADCRLDHGSPRRLAYVLYTSGSTGVPKGVAIEHGSAVALLRWARHAYQPGDLCGVLATTSISHDCSVFEIFGPLCWGGTVILAGDALEAVPSSERVTLMSLGPMTLLHLIKAQRLPPHLRAVNVGGESPPPELIAALREQLPHLRLYHLYGPAEDTTYSTCAIAEGPAALTSIGRPLPGTAVYILDAGGSPVPVGVPGELILSGVGLARGYLHRPDLTAERFLPDPFSPRGNDRMYRTGDLARYLPDGRIEMLGRLDQQIKIRGFRIEPAEIEAVLMSHALVEEAIVMAHNDGAGERTLVAWFVPRTPELPPRQEELREHLRAHLPAPMIPAAYVQLDKFPRLPNGKVNRAELSLPGDWRQLSSARAGQPRNETEMRLMALWQDVLDRSGLGIRDRFLDVGGHSLTALVLVSRIHREFGARISLAALLEQGTIETIAPLLRDHVSRESIRCLVTLRRKGSLPPLFLLHAGRGSVFCYHALVAHLDRERPVYAFQSRALDGLQAPQTRLETMAEEYLSELRQVRAHGPYFLAGWCMGGLLAFEMARQLSASGERVAFTGLLDTTPPCPRQSQDKDSGEIDLLFEFAEHLELKWDNAPSRAALKRLPADILLPRVLELAKAAEVIPRELELPELKLMFRTFQANCRAEAAYEGAPWRCFLHVFRAEEPLGPPPEPPLETWTQFGLLGCAFHDVPGNHHTMLRDAAVETLAARVESTMEESYE